MNRFDVLLNDFMICKICDHAGDPKTFQVREMMLGYREEFTYFQCGHCGCLQIAKIPNDMSKYYPAEYYSFTYSPAEILKNPLRKILKKRRDRYAVFSKGLVGKYLCARHPSESLRMLSNVQNLTRHTKILDVGCGSGAMLYALQEIGFIHLLGVDPFIAADIDYDNGLHILKKEIHELTGEWDVIVFHHVFEHLAAPRRVLQTVAQLLSLNGVCLIRTPTVSSYAWAHYGVNWVQLDAPRHFFVHSTGSLEKLAQQAGLNLTKTVYDATAFQFWGSEQYLRDIPLFAEQSYAVNRRRSIFSKAELAAFNRQATVYNRENRGDSATFCLQKN